MNLIKGNKKYFRTTQEVAKINIYFIFITNEKSCMCFHTGFNQGHF